MRGWRFRPWEGRGGRCPTLSLEGEGPANEQGPSREGGQWQEEVGPPGCEGEDAVWVRPLGLLRSKEAHLCCSAGPAGR